MPISQEEWAAATFIGGRPGFTPQIGALVDMMHYARLTTLDAAEGLSTEELDTIPEGFSNSIGMLLAHIAATDRLYQAASFDNRDAFALPDYVPYIGAMTFGEIGEQVRGRSLESLMYELDETRAQTLSRLAQKDDAWLASRLNAPGFGPMNQHWAWFHVMEDEVSHRGQMRLIRKALKRSKISQE